MFGPYYECIGFNGFQQIAHNRYRFIVITEVIQHDADPVSFLLGLRALLADDGFIILITQNKSAFPKNSLWITDVP